MFVVQQEWPYYVRNRSAHEDNRSDFNILAKIHCPANQVTAFATSRLVISSEGCLIYRRQTVYCRISATKQREMRIFVAFEDVRLPMDVQPGQTVGDVKTVLKDHFKVKAKTMGRYMITVISLDIIF